MTCQSNGQSVTVLEKEHLDMHSFWIKCRNAYRQVRGAWDLIFAAIASSILEKSLAYMLDYTDNVWMILGAAVVGGATADFWRKFLLRCLTRESDIAIEYGRFVSALDSKLRAQTHGDGQKAIRERIRATLIRARDDLTNQAHVKVISSFRELLSKRGAVDVVACSSSAFATWFNHVMVLYFLEQVKEKGKSIRNLKRIHVVNADGIRSIESNAPPYMSHFQAFCSMHENADMGLQLFYPGSQSSSRLAFPQLTMGKEDKSFLIVYDLSGFPLAAVSFRESEGNYFFEDVNAQDYHEFYTLLSQHLSRIKTVNGITHKSEFESFCSAGDPVVWNLY